MTRLVVVGNGMAGMACVEQILKYAPPFQITVFGDETHVNYNRVLLSSVLAGEKAADDIVINPLDWYRQHHIDLPLDNVGTKGTVNKTGVQATGSTNAYGRRYLVLMIFNVSTEDEDNDGNDERKAEASGP